MLRMVLLGLFIPLGVGILAAMEFRTPPRTVVAAVRPVAETTVGVSGSRDVLAKADRLEMPLAKSETSTQLGPSDERISPSESPTQDTPIMSNPRRHDPKVRKVSTAVLAKQKPKTIDVKRVSIPDRSKAANDTAACRLNAFGGLRKALNLSGCEI